MILPAVDEIDFLPPGFHDRLRRRRARGWRWGVAAAFVGLACLGLLGNRLQHARLQATRDRLAPLARDVADLDAKSEALRGRIESLGLKADLRARLRLRPATTRVLSAVTSPLPPHTILTDVQVGDERTVEGPPAESKANEEAVPPVRRDLDRLAETDDRLTVTLRGIAPDDAAVSDYLAGLGRSGLFDDIRLLFTDHHDHQGHDLRTFSAQLRVRAGRAPAAAPAAERTAGAGGPEGGAS